MTAFRRNVTWQVVGSIGQAVIGAAFLFVVGRSLGAADFGLYSVVTGVVLVANGLFEPRMQDVAARHLWDIDAADADRAAHRTLFFDLLMVEVVGKALPLLALICLAPLIAVVSGLPQGSTWLIVVAAVGTYIARIGGGVSAGVLRVRGRSDIYAGCVSAEQAARLAVVAILAISGHLSVAACVIVQAVTGPLANAAQLAFAARPIVQGARWRLSLEGLAQRLRPCRRLIFANLGLSASDLMNRDLDIALMSPFVGKDQIGIYKMAKTIAMMAWRLVDPVYLALMPEISRLMALGAFAELRRLLNRSSIGLLVLATALSLCAYAAVAVLAVPLLGHSFATVRGDLPLFMLAVILSAPWVWGHPLAVALNRPEIVLVGSVLGAATGLLAFLALTPLYGAHGAAIAWACTFILNFLFTATFSRRLLAARASGMPAEAGPQA